MAMTCNTEGDHILEPGVSFASGGCRHATAENMSNREFRQLPHARCAVPGCNKVLGVVCPDCDKVY
jgi:hypothetical protein